MFLKTNGHDGQGACNFKKSTRNSQFSSKKALQLPLLNGVILFQLNISC